MSLQKTRFLAILSELLKKTNVRIRKLVKKYVDMDRNHFLISTILHVFIGVFLGGFKKIFFFKKNFSQKNQFLSQFCLIFREGDLKIRIPRQKIAQYSWSSYGFLRPKTTF